MSLDRCEGLLLGLMDNKYYFSHLQACSYHRGIDNTPPRPQAHSHLLACNSYSKKPQSLYVVSLYRCMYFVACCAYAPA